MGLTINLQRKNTTHERTRWVINVRSDRNGAVTDFGNVPKPDAR